MTFLKNLLNAPIRKTALVLAVSLIVYLLLTFTLLYLTRVTCAASYFDTGSCHGTNLQMFGSMILNDFELISRIIAELSFIVLVGQVIHRLVTKSPK